jgi:hypothetical protein
MFNQSYMLYITQTQKVQAAHPLVQPKQPPEPIDALRTAPANGFEEIGSVWGETAYHAAAFYFMGPDEIMHIFATSGVYIEMSYSLNLSR